MTLSTVTIGAQTSSCTFLNDQYSLNQPETISYDKSNLIENALLFLNAPYLWGGRTPLGIDCSGFTQLIYRMNGFDLLRDASQQATQGEVLSFIEESEPGDLAFFDNNEGAITHVGLIMSDNYIIHAHGKVRIDRLDQSGIFNVEKKVHTHKLRVIKKIL
jgi:cell wall-associated NlpC family hydrolase